MKRVLLAAVALAGLAALSGAEPSALDLRASEVQRLFGEHPPDVEPLFSPEFLAQIPAAQLMGVIAGIRSRSGECREVRPGAGNTATRGTFDLVFSGGVRVPMTLVVEDRAPSRIVGLRFGIPTRDSASLSDVAREISKLPGQTTFCARDLDADRMLAATDPDRPLAIGSAFKLYVLAATVRAVEKGRLHWEDLVRLDSRRRSLPSGALQSWPDGSPVTIHTLAALMISASDNTAADELLERVGRGSVEDLLAESGMARPEKNRPFLSTADLFRLKWGIDPEARAAYLRDGEAGRRRRLEELRSSVPLGAVRVSSSPVEVSSIEWFASSAELCRLLDRFRRDDSKDGEIARRILAINPGLPIDSAAWPYVGYKGGSEPGVLDLTYLVRSKEGRSYAVSAAWNDPAAVLDDSRLEGLVQRAIELLPAAAAHP